MTPRVAAVLLVVAAAAVAAAPRDGDRKSAGRAWTLDCVVCNALAVELQHELAATANSTEVIELSRRPSSDLGRQQYQKGGRAIKYVDSEMRITDALQAACQALKTSYRVQAVDGRRRLVRVRADGDRVAATDREGVDWGSGDKIQVACEEMAEERERDFIEAVRGATDLGLVCYAGAGSSSKRTTGSAGAVCGGPRLGKCPAGEYSFAVNGTGAAPCWPCERGAFQPALGATACTPCPQNLSTAARGSTSEEACRQQCASGSHGPGGVEPCKPCPVHTYQPSSGASECMPCPGGKGTVAEGAARRDACVAVCGDGRVAAGEACDDGNALGGDGCSAKCQVEDGWSCADVSAKSSGRGPGTQTCRRLPAKRPGEEDGGLNGRSDGAPSGGSRRTGAGGRQGKERSQGMGEQRRRRGQPRPPPVAGLGFDEAEPPRVGVAVEKLGSGGYVRVPRIDEILSAKSGVRRRGVDPAGSVCVCE